MSKKIRPSEWEQLISDYHRDNNFIRKQQFKWLKPKETKMARLPNRSEMATADAPADQFQGDGHKNKSSSDELLDKGVNPKKKKSKGKPPMSPILQVMKAVTDHALNPKHKKVKKNVATKSETQKPGSRAEEEIESAQKERKESESGED